MEEGKKKYLEQNPASRRLLFMDLVHEIDRASNAIHRLTRAAKAKKAITVGSGGPETIILIQDQFALYQDADAMAESTKALAEWFAARRLVLYGERNEWLETWPDLVDLAGLQPLQGFRIAPPEIASDEPTGP